LNLREEVLHLVVVHRHDVALLRDQQLVAHDRAPPAEALE
jgi:hypothetical protein